MNLYISIFICMAGTCTIQANADLASLEWMQMIPLLDSVSLDSPIP